MGDSNPILTSGNAYLAVTNIAGAAGQQMQFQGVPLGTSDGSATGALGVKVVGAGAGGAINVASTPQTPTSGTLAASSSFTIPSGSKGWTFTVLTGTGGIGGTTGLPAGFSDSDPNTLAASLTVTTAAASTAYYRYNS